MPLEKVSMTTTISLRTGEDVLLRPLVPADAALLGDYFNGLSTDTRQVYAPHPFDQETADRLCATIDTNSIVRLVALIDNCIVGYFIIVLGVRDSDMQRYVDYDISLSKTEDCAIAPSLADAYQGLGLGRLVLGHCRSIAQQLGFKRMILSGGVRTGNSQAITFYEKTGFRQAGGFERPGYSSYDMIANLEDIP